MPAPVVATPAHAFKSPCRVTPWFSKKNERRVITMVENEEDYKRVIETVPYACEALDGGPVKAYLDIDHKVDMSEVYTSTGTDGKTRYFEKNTRSLLNRIKEEIERIGLFKGRRYYAMSRESRPVKGDKIKLSWRIMFPDVIVADQMALGTYLKAIGYKPDAPFDLSVYNKGRIMNAALCVKPDKEGDAPCPPLDPLFGWGGKLEDRLITVVDPAIPIVNMEEWMPKALVEAPTTPSMTREQSVAGDDHDDEPEKIRKLLSCMSADCAYEQWRDVCFTLRDVMADEKTAFNLFNEWSATGTEKYDVLNVVRTWDSAKKMGKFTLGTLVKRAREENPTMYAELFPKGLGGKGTTGVDIYKSRNYADIKASFEETVFKVVKPVAFYQARSDGSGYIVTSEERIKSAYRNVIYDKVVETKAGPTTKSASFINEWLSDPKMRFYDRTEFDPSRSVPADVFNSFTGYAAERIQAVADEDVAELIQPFTEHLQMLVGEEGARFTMLWLANMVQRPKHKAGVAIVLHSSREGTGKTLPFKWLGEKVIGKDWYRSTTDPASDLFDKHSNGVENRLLVQVEEARGADLHKNIDRLKDLITNNTCRLERKGVDAYEINNFASFVFTTNNDNSVKIGASDRRFVVFDCNDERVGDETYFNALLDAMAKPEMARAMFQHLMAVDLSGVRNFQLIRPITDYYKEMQRANVPNWARYMAVKAAEGDEKGKASEFYLRYTAWADRNGFKETALNQTGFARKVKTLAGVESVRGRTGVKYVFDWATVTSDLKAKNMWDDEAF